MYRILGYTSALLVMLGLVLSNVIASSTLSTSGEELKQIEAEIAALQEHNRELDSEILKQTSLSYLEEQALIRGFVKPDSVIAVGSTHSEVALR